MFTEGNSFSVYPLRVVYIENISLKEKGVNVSIMANVPKRKFKRAVKRNRLKRLIKESFRLNKFDFIEKVASQSEYISIAFLYLSREEKSFFEINAAMKQALEMLSSKIPIRE